LSKAALPTPPDSDVERHPESRRKRLPSEFESIAPPPAAWEDDSATIKDATQYSTMPVVEQDAVLLEKHMSTISQQEKFEKEVFKNSAIYCDL
jgi:3-dehydroquinate dehydratase